MLHNIAAFCFYEYWALRNWNGQDGKGSGRDWSIAHREGKQSVNRICGFWDGPTGHLFMSPKQVSQTIHLCYDRVIGGDASSIQQKHTWVFI